MTKAGQGATPERELKFIANRKTFKTALTLPLLGEATEGGAGRRLKSVYFDTDAGDLIRHGLTLRVRRTKGVYVMGLKTAAESDQGIFERGESEVKLPSAEPDLTLFDEAVAREIRKIAGGKALAPKFGYNIRRSTRTVEIAGTAIEVALDSGFLFAGERREPTHEIELELKSGEPAALFEFGLALFDALPVTLGFRSKAERAAQLLLPGPPPVRATPPAFTAQTPMDEAIGAVLRNCLSQFIWNLPALESIDAIEAVHQMRVSMRRLRSALGLFNRLFPCTEFEALRAESRRIGTVLGEARDWDVFVEMIRSGPLARFRDAPGFDKLLNAAQTRADAGHTAVSLMANDKAMTRFALSLEHFVARRGWRNGVPEDHLLWLAEPVAGFAARSLDRLHLKLRKRGRHFGSLTPEARHALRIKLKQMRYATEFFGRLFHPSSAAERYGHRAAALQDLLGQVNDATIGLRLMKELDFGADAEFAYAAGVAAGWCGRGSLGDKPALREAWRPILRADRYWRRDPEKRGLKSV